MAGHKARYALDRLASGVPTAGTAPLVLAADTIVVLDGDILGKPSSEEHALAMLTRLAGNTHTVVTACCLHPADAEPLCFADSARVTFASWPEALLAFLCGHGRPLDKAGSLRHSGQGAPFWAERIEGSWSTVVGLPMSRTMSALLALGALAS